MPVEPRSRNARNSMKIKKHVTFCADGANQIVNWGRAAELETVDFLLENLQPGLVGDFHILVNFNMEMRSGASGRTEIDLVVIVRQGVFLIEVKGYHGLIEGSSQGGWYVGGRKMDGNPLAAIEQKAKVMFTQLFHSRQGALPNLNGQVIGLVVLPNASEALKFDGSRLNRPLSVTGLDGSLLNVLSNKTRLLRSERRSLTDIAIKRIRDELLRMNSGVTGPPVVDRYAILGELEPGDLYEAYEGQHVVIRSRRVRIKSYTLPRLVGEEADYHRRLFKRGALSSFRLVGHPHIVQSLDFFHDPENPARFYEITELLDRKRLDTLLLGRQDPVAPLQQIAYLIDLCHAVQYAHSNNVLHRNINPETIFVGLDGGLKLADFDFARLDDNQATVSRPGKTLVENDCSAPEVVQSPAQATPASDIYSIGAVWYYMAHPKAFEQGTPPDPAQVDQMESLAESTRVLIKQMLSRDPDQRPTIETLLELLTTSQGMLTSDTDDERTDEPQPPLTGPAAEIIDEPTAEGVDRYRLLRPLPSGELFDAFEAQHLTISNYRVRLKRYELRARQAGSFTMFQRGAETTLSLDHPHILRTIDFFAATDNPQIHYEITELWGGERMEEWLTTRQDAIPLATQLAFVRVLADVLAYTHDLGILHRNISPRCIFIKDDKQLKLADFHFAHVDGQATISRPNEQMTLLENPCTAPEIYRDPSSATAASDVYSVGAVWFMLARTPLAPGQQAEEPDATLVGALSGLSADAARLMQQLLDPEPQNRPENGAALLAAIDALEGQKN